MNKGKLIILSGPSGCGKSTVIKKLMAERENIVFSVSATTRKPREGEVNGREYYFVSREEFDRMVREGEMLEHAEFVGNCYGTPRRPIEEKTAEGTTVILDIEVQGAQQVKKLMSEAVSVFLMPPSLEELEKRLRHRGTDDEETIRGRLKRAQEEIVLADQYDHVVINDDADRAAAELGSIIDR